MKYGISFEEVTVTIQVDMAVIDDIAKNVTDTIRDYLQDEGLPRDSQLIALVAKRICENQKNA